MDWTGMAERGRYYVTIIGSSENLSLRQNIQKSWGSEKGQSRKGEKEKK